MKELSKLQCSVFPTRAVRLTSIPVEYDGIGMDAVSVQMPVSDE
jgi:hypothetical protein